MALVDVIIGYAKGAQGNVGPQGPAGPQGPTGPQGPISPLVNNADATIPGIAALDSAMGKVLNEKISETNDKLNNYFAVNAKYNGVVGDGITDDSDAINELLSDYDNVYLPSGIYLTTKPLVCKPNNTLYGSGKIITTMTSGPVITLQGESIANKAVGLRIDGITIEGNPVTGDMPLTGIYCAKTKNIVINNVTLTGFNQSVRIAESEDIKVTNCKMYNNIKTSSNIDGYGCLTQDTKNLLISGCIIEAERHSIYLYLFNNAVVSDCELYGVDDVTTPTGYELVVKFAGGSWGVIDNCHIHTAYGGIEVADNQDNTVGSKNVFIKNCLFTNKTVNPSRATGWIYSFETLSDNINIDNCIFHQTTDRVIVIEGGYRHYLNNCKIYNDNTTPSTMSCIRVLSTGYTASLVAHDNFIDGFSVAFDLQGASTAVMYAYNTVIKNVTNVCPESNWKYVQIIGTTLYGSLDLSDITGSTFDATGFKTATVAPSVSLNTLTGGEIGQTLLINLGNSGAKITNSGNIRISGAEITSGTNKVVMLVKTSPLYWAQIGLYPTS